MASNIDDKVKVMERHCLKALFRKLAFKGNELFMFPFFLRTDSPMCPDLEMCTKSDCEYIA